MAPQLIIQGVNIVLHGQFNPTLFHPTWLATQNLIRPQEAEAADITLIHPDVTIFDLEWLQIRVTQTKFQAATVQEAYYEALRDIVMGIFTVLHQTPLHALDIHREFHYQLTSAQAWDTLRDRLAPKNAWDGILQQPDMKTLTIQGLRPDDYAGYLWLTTAPSSQTDWGVFVQVQDHYELTGTSMTSTGAQEVVTILSQNWQASMKQGLDMTAKIVHWGDANL